MELNEMEKAALSGGGRLSGKGPERTLYDRAVLK